jgi:hypothetical protein
MMLQVRVSVPKTLSTAFPAQSLGPYTLERVTVVTDGQAPSHRGGYPTTVTLSV